MRGNMMRMSWAPRGAFFVVLFAALSLAAASVAQACPLGATQQHIVHCTWNPGAMVAVYTCTDGIVWRQTNWWVIWGCGG